MAGDPDHFRDDIAGLAHLNGVPDAQTKLPDKVLIMEGGARHGRAGQKDRIKAGRGGQDTGAAHGHFDAAQGGLLDLRRVLEGDGPAREFVGGAHLFPLGKIVYLDDRTVHIKIQLGTVLSDLLDLCNGLLNVVYHMVARRDRQTKALEVVQTVRMAGQFLPADLLDVEHKNGQAAASGDLCILLPQGTCRRIARVLEGSGPLQFLLRAQLLESLVRHIDLAAHLQKLRRIFQRLGDAFDCPDVLGHILAYHAVAAGGRPDEFSVLILQTAGKAVDLDLDHIFRFDACIPYAAVKVAQLIIRKCIQQTFHLDRMGHLGKAPAGGPTHFLGRRSRRDQLRELRFQRFQFPGQCIVFKILQLRGILVIIEPVVLFNDSAQLLHTLLGLFQFQTNHSPAG